MLLKYMRYFSICVFICVFALVCFEKVAAQDIYQITEADVNKWRAETARDGWSSSYNNEVMYPFLDILEKVVIEASKEAKKADCDGLFESILSDIKTLRNMKNIHSNVVFLVLRFTLLMDEHLIIFNTLNNKNGPITTSFARRKKSLCDSDMKEMFVYPITDTNLSLLNAVENTQKLSLQEFTRQNVVETKTTELAFQNQKYISNTINDGVIYFPTMQALDTNIFILLSTLKVHPLGVSMAVIHADGYLMSPFTLCLHDLVHSIFQKEYYRASIDTNVKILHQINVALRELDKTKPQVAEMVRLMLFLFLHEVAKTTSILKNKIQYNYEDISDGCLFDKDSFKCNDKASWNSFDTIASLMIFIDLIKEDTLTFSLKNQSADYMKNAIDWLLNTFNTMDQSNAIEQKSD